MNMRREKESKLNRATSATARGGRDISVSIMQSEAELKNVSSNEMWKINRKLERIVRIAQTEKGTMSLRVHYTFIISI